MEDAGAVRKKRGLSTERARIVRKRGHNDALEFALAIGLKHDYVNNPSAKKDVIDPSGDSHSVKSGEVKWQIFLYGPTRFRSDFAVMNGVGQLLIACIDSFPPTFEEYQADKQAAKERLRPHMRELAEKLRDKVRLKAFINKSMFNDGEVDYLTVKDGGVYHIFHYTDVISAMSEKLAVENSQARQKGQTSEQKVILKYKCTTLGEIEMRNDSPVHYKEIRFNMMKPKVMEFLFYEIPQTGQYRDMVRVYGSAHKRFGRWKP